MSELKCCPFCGGEAKIVKYCGKKTIVYVECTNCLAYMGNQRIITSSNRGEEYFESEEKLINAWNTRTPMANIVEKLEELKNEDVCMETSCAECKEKYKNNSKKDCYEPIQKLVLDKAINIVKPEINNGSSI